MWSSASAFLRGSALATCTCAQGRETTAPLPLPPDRTDGRADSLPGQFGHLLLLPDGQQLQSLPDGLQLGLVELQAGGKGGALGAAAPGAGPGQLLATETKEIFVQISRIAPRERLLAGSQRDTVYTYIMSL